MEAICCQHDISNSMIGVLKQEGIGMIPEVKIESVFISRIECARSAPIFVKYQLSFLVIFRAKYEGNFILFYFICLFCLFNMPRGVSQDQQNDVRIYGWALFDIDSENLPRATQNELQMNNISLT